MTSGPYNPYNAPPSLPLASNTYIVPLPNTYHTNGLVRLLPRQHPIPVTALPSLPARIPSSPSFISSTHSFKQYQPASIYPPRPIITQPSTQSLSNCSHWSNSSENLLSPRTDPSLADIHSCYVLEAKHSGPVWIGSEVTLSQRGPDTYCKRYQEGRLVDIYVKEMTTTWFVFKSDDTKKMVLVEVRNSLVRWPLRYRVITYLRSFWAYLHSRAHGHLLPL
jgi:hypothetical protein